MNTPLRSVSSNTKKSPGLRALDVPTISSLPSRVDEVMSTARPLNAPSSACCWRASFDASSKNAVRMVPST